MALKEAKEEAMRMKMDKKLDVSIKGEVSGNLMCWLWRRKCVKL